MSTTTATGRIGYLGRPEAALAVKPSKTKIFFQFLICSAASALIIGLCTGHWKWVHEHGFSDFTSSTMGTVAIGCILGAGITYAMQRNRTNKKVRDVAIFLFTAAIATAAVGWWSGCWRWIDEHGWFDGLAKYGFHCRSESATLFAMGIGSVLGIGSLCILRNKKTTDQILDEIEAEEAE